MKVRKAIIPAAGLGTRFLPATKAQPKEMLPIVDKPTIQYIIEEAIESGIEDIMIVTGKNKRAIEDHFDKSVELEMILQETGKHDLLDLVKRVSNMVDIHYIRQKQPLGLGHAILCARKFINNEPFAVLLGDDIIESQSPALKQLMTIYDQHQTSIIGVQEVDWNAVNKFGIIMPEPDNTTPSAAGVEAAMSRVIDLIEKPSLEEAPSNLAVMGRYIIQPEIFDILEKTQPGRGGEIQLTDALRELNQIQQMIAYRFEGTRYDVGDKLGYIQATIEFALRRPDLQDEVRDYLIRLVKQWD
jgi:UTP--glucose-1-phosphate uridylyltransferase